MKTKNILISILLILFVITLLPLGDSITAATTSKLGKLTINNKIKGRIYISFEGPKNYRFWVPPGKTVHELVPGTYKYSYYADGSYEKGTLNLKKSGGVFVMKIDMGKLKIKSKFPQNVFVTFSGPKSYYLWVLPGRTTQEMRVGNYEYKYWANGKNHEGSVNVPKRGNTLILQPPKVCACNKNIYNCADFTYQYKAQECFLYCWGQVNKDVHRLDGDHDGRACEALP